MIITIYTHIWSIYIEICLLKKPCGSKRLGLVVKTLVRMPVSRIRVPGFRAWLSLLIPASC